MALLAHRHLLALPTPDPETLLAVGRAWEAVRGHVPTEAAVGRRIAALSARIGPREAIDAALATAEADLVEAIERMRVPLAVGSDAPPILAAAIDAVWERRADPVGELATARIRRARAGGVLPGPDEWIEWNALRTAWSDARLVASPERRRMLFDGSWGSTCNFAVWLTNERKERLLAHAIFQWLREEAIAVDASAESRTLLDRNCRATR